MSHHQVNLLPEEALEIYHKHRRGTVASRIIEGVAILCLLVGVFAGSAALYLRLISEADQERLTVVEGSQELRRSEELEKLISGFSQELVVLRDLKVKQYDPTFLVREFINVLPENAQLTRFQLSFLPEDEAEAAAALANPATNAPTIYLQGTAATRADVLAFQHAMETFDFVSTIEAPTQNIIYPTNATFVFELELIPAAVAERVKIEASENVGSEEEESAPEPVSEEAPAEEVAETEEGA